MKLTYVLLIGAALLALTPAHAQLIVANPGTPTEITNTKSAPVQMQDVEDPLLDPMQFNLALELNPGVLFGSSSGYTVPAGKRLVITGVMLRADIISGLSDIVRANLHTTVAGSQSQHPFRMHRVFQAEFGAVFGTIRTRLYADPGTTVHFLANHVDPQFKTKYTAVVYGYLEKAQ